MVFFFIISTSLSVVTTTFKSKLRFLLQFRRGHIIGMSKDYQYIFIRLAARFRDREPVYIFLRTYIFFFKKIQIMLMSLLLYIKAFVLVS